MNRFLQARFLRCTNGVAVVRRMPFVLAVGILIATGARLSATDPTFVGKLAMALDDAKKLDLSDETTQKLRDLIDNRRERCGGIESASEGAYEGGAGGKAQAFS